jgi:ligand-binding sensor domain-containing protein
VFHQTNNYDEQWENRKFVEPRSGKRSLPEAVVQRRAFSLGIVALIALIAWALLRPASHEPVKPLPTGWSIVRPPHDVATLLVEPNEVWTGGVEGVWIVDRRTLLARPAFPADNGPQHVHALLRDVDGALLIGHDGGLTRLANGQTKKIELPAGFKPVMVLSLHITRGGALWVGTDRGAAIREGGAWRALHVSDGLANEVVNFLYEDRDSGMWVGSYDAPRGGVSHLTRDGQWQRWYVKDGLPHANITSICPEGQGRIWAGGGLLDRGGAARFENSGESWRLNLVLGKKDGLAGEKVRSIFIDSKNRFWFGSEYDGLAVRIGDKWKVYRQADGLSHPEIKVIREDDAGNLWIGTRDGITRIKAAALPSAF